MFAAGNSSQRYAGSISHASPDRTGRNKVLLYLIAEVLVCYLFKPLAVLVASNFVEEAIFGPDSVVTVFAFTRYTFHWIYHASAFGFVLTRRIRSHVAPLGVMMIMQLPLPVGGSALSTAVPGLGLQCLCCLLKASPTASIIFELQGV